MRLQQIPSGQCPGSPREHNTSNSKSDGLEKVAQIEKIEMQLRKRPTM